MAFCMCFLVLTSLLELSLCGIVIDLGGKDWQVESSDGAYKNLSGTVPGSIYTDLINHGIIENPYYRSNDEAYMWIGRQSWIYTKNFTVDASILTVYDTIDLECNGLDTVAFVYINLHLVGYSDNMFIYQSYPVKQALKAGLNEIMIAFKSPVVYASDQFLAYPYDVPPDCAPEAQHGECHPNFIRKEQCSFSWDWGPSFPTVGIWKPIYLAAYNSIAMKYFTVNTNRVSANGSQLWQLEGSVYFDISTTTSTVVVPAINIQIPSVLSYTENSVELSEHQWAFSVTVQQSSSIKEWMPNGHGEQTLYPITVTMHRTDGTNTSIVYKIGFRTVELVQEKIAGSEGLSFYFRINGVPIFMKGSNWIPADSFQERISEATIRQLLTSARDANMNMLRVWGGGVYESDLFYDLADELGITIWQDMMFACAMYPTNPDFLESVRSEIRHQVGRLQHHASIVVWSGNNENEGALSNNWYNLPSYKQYYEDYVRLYIDTVKTVLQQTDQSRPFVPSSPSNGIETEAEGWVARDPQSELYGDVHHYDYASDMWNWTVFPRPRFASEYGLQSWCSLETLEPVSTEDDWSWDSDFSTRRNHHPDGNAQMKGEFLQHFDFPMRHPISKRTQFEDEIYLSQMNQAVGIQTETELYRRLQGRIVDGGKGHTMGALYWQLNDIWPAPTWASIEYGGKWKPLHYYARRFFNSSLLSPVLEGSTVRVYMVDDTLIQVPNPPPHNSERSGEYNSGTRGEHVSNIERENSENSNNYKQFDIKQENRLNKAIENSKIVEDKILRFKPRKQETENPSISRVVREKPTVQKAPAPPPPIRILTLHLMMYSFTSLEPIKTWTKQFQQPIGFGENSQIIYEEELDTLLQKTNCSKETCFLYVTTDPTADDAPSNFLLFSYFTNVLHKGLKQRPIDGVSVEQVSPQKFQVTVSASAVAAFVWLDVSGISGRFSDNAFHMVSPTRVLYFYSWAPGSSLADVRAGLRYRSLMDMYQLPMDA